MLQLQYGGDFFFFFTFRTKDGVKVVAGACCV